MRKSRYCLFLGLFFFLPGAKADPTPDFYDCDQMLAQVKELFAAKDTALLSLNILRGECPHPILYEAAYYQGFAFYLLSDYAGALADFDLARSLAGPWDEQILYYVWRIQGSLKDKRERERIFREFKTAYPASRYLPGMEAAGHATLSHWEGAAVTGFAWLYGDKSYQGPKSRTFLNGGLNQEKGDHDFQEFVNVSGNFSLDSRIQHFYGAEAGAQYRYHGFSAQGSVGRLYSVYDTLGTRAGVLGEPEPVKGWEWQGAFSSSLTLSGAGEWEWTPSLAYYRTESSFISYGAGLDIDRFRDRKRGSLQLRGEYQLFEAAGCADAPSLGTPCEIARLAAGELEWDLQRLPGRHVLGLTLKYRGELGVDTSGYRRNIASLGGQWGFRFTRKLKWMNAVEAGVDWIAGTTGPDPVLNLSSSLSARF